MAYVFQAHIDFVVLGEQGKNEGTDRGMKRQRRYVHMI